MKHSTKNNSTGCNEQYHNQTYKKTQESDSSQIQDILKPCHNCEGLGFYYAWKGNLGHNDPDGVEVEQLCLDCGGSGIYDERDFFVV